MSSYHPDGLTVDIVGIIASDCGRNCDDHPFCGEIVKLDVVVHFCREMIHVAGGPDGGPGREEPAVVVYWVTNKIDACRIGFLPRHMNHHAARYNGILGQITATFSAGHHNHAVREKWHRNMGFCRAAVISPSMVTQWWWNLQVAVLLRLGRCLPEWQQLRLQRNFVWEALCLVVFIRRISVTGSQ